MPKHTDAHSSHSKRRRFGVLCGVQTLVRGGGSLACPPSPLPSCAVRYPGLAPGKREETMRFAKNGPPSGELADWNLRGHVFCGIF